MQLRHHLVVSCDKTGIYVTLVINGNIIFLPADSHVLPSYLNCLFEMSVSICQD